MFCSKSTSDVLIKLPHLGLSSIVYFNKKLLHIIWYSISSLKSNKKMCLLGFIRCLECLQVRLFHPIGRGFRNLLMNCLGLHGVYLSLCICISVCSDGLIFLRFLHVLMNCLGLWSQWHLMISPSHALYSSLDRSYHCWIILSRNTAFTRPEILRKTVQLQNQIVQITPIFHWSADQA